MSKPDERPGQHAVGHVPRRRNGALPSAGEKGGGRRCWRVGKLAVLMAAALGAAGCQEGIHWQVLWYPDAQARSRAQNKLMFIYFFEWGSVDCTHFDQGVLSKPEVLAVTRDMFCVPLVSHWDAPLMTQFGLDRIPAFAVVAPDGQLLTRGQGPVTLDELLNAIRSAQAKFAATSQNTTPPTKPP